MSNSTQPADDNSTERPIYWFATLDFALERGDIVEAARAVQELRHIGIEVLYCCRPQAPVRGQIDE